MKSRIVLLLTTLLSAGAVASPAVGPYAGLKLGFTDYSKSTLPAQYGLTAGYDVAINNSASLGIELNAIELGDSIFFKGFTAIDYKTYSYSAVLKPKYHFTAIGNQPAYVAAVLGVSRIEESREYYVRGEGYRKDRDQDTTGIYGLEVGREIVPNVNIIGYFSYQKADLFGEDNYYRSYGFGINFGF
ncbi:outer membrane beta-barrel protein [Photobacterium sp. DA100]|uniref:outer membrane beta-barrel protein n=1 Tax=Photobacterium sp. DA100 TaxID=3027472 RepID=UPI00247ABF33|nr:outer membrane beta-barrel protein [Photobacterium sp. DA100]WEM41786.1 outer membrane beta-barrel protein [Photobacterium sp. DA100]